MEAAPISTTAVQEQTLNSRVALYISCRKLKDLDIRSKSDPQVEVYMKEKSQNKWILIGKTETMLNNLNPDFTTFIECNYYFEKEQHLKFKVWDVDEKDRDFIGQVETTIGKIFGS
jgi:Ca2+-dependent lipid-binding protein